MVKLLDILKEIKVNKPGTIPKVSFDTLKKALIEDIDGTYHSLLDGEEDEEDIQKYINDFAEEINKINWSDRVENEIEEVYEKVGFAREQFTTVLLRIFVRN